MGRKHAAGRLPARVSVCAVALAIALAIAGCGAGSSSKSAAKQRHKPKRVQAVAAPAGLLSASAPQANGIAWVLAGSERVRTINEIQLSTGKQEHATGVSPDARAVTQSSTGLIALGLGTARAGAVELMNGSTGSLDATVPLSGPVIALAFGDDGTTLYALEGAGKVRAVSVIDTTTRKVERSIGLPSDAVSIVPTPDQRAIWSAQASGSIQETSVAGNKAITTFSAGAAATAIAISPDGNTLYVLKGTEETENIAAVAVATETVQQVLPAARHSVALATSLDGSQLYDFVGAPAYGNIQILDL